MSNCDLILFMSVGHIITISAIISHNAVNLDLLPIYAQLLHELTSNARYLQLIRNVDKHGFCLFIVQRHISTIYAIIANNS